MPFLTAPTAGEHDSLATFAQQQIDQVATALHGLETAQLARTPSASGMSLGALARHVLLVAEGAVRTFTAAPAAGSEPERTPQQLQAEGTIAPEAVREEDSAETLSRQLREAGRELAAAIRAADLDVHAPVPDAPWFAGRETWSMRWFALHQIEENARHAGHADILRESLDGTGAYELNALVDGEPWPPAGW